MKPISTLFLLILLSLGVSSQNLIQNPGFETATVGIPSGQGIPSYPTELDFWTATATDGEFILEPTLAYAGNGFLSVLQNSGAYDGSPWLGTGGGGYDQAGQVFSVSPSTGYDLTFWYRAGDGSRYGYGAGTMVVHVESISPSAATLTSINAPTTQQWQLYTKTFVTGPSDTQAIVIFAGMGPGDVDTWIDDVTVSVSTATGISQRQALEAKVYPNPVSDQLFVSTPSGNPMQYELMNMLGSTVAVGQTGGSQIDVSHLPNGMYLLRLRSDSGSKVEKIQVKH